MIDYIHIRHFQVHRDLKIVLTGGVNALTGTSDVGKTSVIRALRWLAFNRPLGKSFQSWGSKKSPWVEVSLDAGSTIVRHTVGKYELLIKGKEPQHFAATGASVPAPVQEALNISELSWQMQMDAPFLLSESAGEVARRLNGVSDLTVIDRTIAAILHRSRMINAEKAANEERMREVVLALHRYDHLDETEVSLEMLRKVQAQIGQLEKSIATGRDILKTVSRFEREERRGEHVLRQRERIDRATELFRVYQETRATLAKEEGVLYLLLASKKRTQQTKNELIRLERQWKEQFPDVCPLCGAERGR